ncbi:MAG: DUF2309 family protein [Acidobacteriota bacterium]|nr:DUF2309 family protein [Acidobacteriota bacterium]
MIRQDIDELIDESSSYVGAMWPLDRAVAVNPLLDRLDDDFANATGELGRQLGLSLWPARAHLAEASRRGLGPDVGDEGVVDEPLVRPGTVLERVRGVESKEARRARRIVGQTLLEAVSTKREPDAGVVPRAVAILEDPASWVELPLPKRRDIGALLRTESLEGLVARLKSFNSDDVTAELSAHFARTPGWSAWSKWSDLWRRQAHPAALSRREFLTVSLAVDLALLGEMADVVFEPPSRAVPASTEAGMRRLTLLESMVHAPLLRAVRTELAGGATARWQIVTCIDVRSEHLRRVLEQRDDVQTIGFAGFFGVPATITAEGEGEARESLPVLLEPSVAVQGGRGPGDWADSVVALSGTFAELTHEPGAMFALAEGTGWFAVPWLASRTLVPRRKQSGLRDAGTWVVESRDRATLAESALRTMGLTTNFTPEVVFVGHASRSRANTHYSTLDCGACAGRAGGTNAIILAELLNDEEIRRTLAQRGIDIPSATRFVAGEHNTTTEEVTLFAGASSDLGRIFDEATDAVSTSRTGQFRPSRSRRALRRRASDWGETRPEWGLAGNAAFVVAPRSSSRGADLRGQCFLHSYDSVADVDGSILRSILSAPVVVAQWINAAYYFSTVAPDVLGAGDKTLLNPVGDFASIAGDDPDLKLGLPWQSVADGARPQHLPVRLLVAVEAPLTRTESIVRSEPVVRRLVEGRWIRLVGRDSAAGEWHEWIAGTGWELV